MNVCLMFPGQGTPKPGMLCSVLGLDAENEIPYDRCAQLAIMAAKECLEHSGSDYSEEDPFRRGVAVGTSLGGMLNGQTFHRQWLSQGRDQADANDLQLYPLHAMVDVLSKKYHFKGVKNVISTACAASGNIVGYGSDMIKSGKHDMMLVGGVDPLLILAPKPSSSATM